MFCRYSLLSLHKKAVMRQMEVLKRYLLIVRKLESQPYVPFDEMIGYVQKEMALRGGSYGATLRTIQRDINDIKELFNMEIASQKGKGYYIEEEYPDPYGQYENLLLNFDLLSAMNADSGIQQYILAEHHRPCGSQILPELIYAVKKLHPIEFDYTFIRYNDSIKHKKVFPHFLKESNQRWYVLAIDGGTLKTFGVDRIGNLKILDGDTFERDNSIDVESLFRDCYGIWDQTDIPIEDIELSYDALDGKFLKSAPLHHSQQIICDTEDEFRITLHLRITNDFVMELLSRSRSLTVVRPASLRERVRKVYEEAQKRNS